MYTEFDCILMDLQMPVRKCRISCILCLPVIDTFYFTVDGEGAARYIKNTNGKNTNTPIIAVSAYSGAEGETNNLFTASLPKPVQKASLLAIMRQLGFKTSTVPGGPGAAKITAARRIAS